MITADILGFFFLLYLIKVKYPGDNENVRKVFKDLFVEILAVFKTVIDEKCFEEYCFLDNYCGIFLKKIELLKASGKLEEINKAIEDVKRSLNKATEIESKKNFEKELKNLEQEKKNFKKSGEEYILRMDFKNEGGAKIYAQVLSECRTYDSEDLLKFGIDPNDPATLGGQVNLFLKSNQIEWKRIGKSVEIKIGTD
jgi:hypothetical protein